MNEKDLTRFWAKVQKTEGCWLWVGAKNNSGYGCFRLNKVTHLAHRVSWGIKHSRTSVDLFVCHSCDVPACVNPSHLWLGTARDNARDMHKKMRNKQARITHCPKGHEHTPENKVPSSKARRCKTCRSLRMQEKRKTDLVWAENENARRRKKLDSDSDYAKQYREKAALRARIARIKLIDPPWLAPHVKALDAG